MSSLVVQHGSAEKLKNVQGCRSYCTCTKINAVCCHLRSRIFYNVTWMANRSKEIYNKADEIPFFITHPYTIIRLIYRCRVKYGIAALPLIKTTTNLSKITPSHPIEGNASAEKRCLNRMLALKHHKVEFDVLINDGRAIPQELVDKIMKSTEPMQCVFDFSRKKFITFNGTGRLFSLKLFFLKEYPHYDPKIVIDSFQI